VSVEAQDARSGSTSLAEDIADAGHVMAALDLVTAFGHVSARVGDHMLITPAAALAGVRGADLVAVPLDAAALPPGAPGESWIHLSVYAIRPDVTAIARAQPPGSFAAAAVTAMLPPLQGQATWLGRAVPVHDNACLLRTADLARAAAAELGRADAVLLRGNGAITTGSSPGLAVARMWLLSSACRAWLAAAAAGPIRPLTDAEFDSWRAAQGELLPRLWRNLRRTALNDPEASRD
jgi:ribulose-5-phosphate 4-epimerase/fuculose-1-phosphate aldolase